MESEHSLYKVIEIDSDSYLKEIHHLFQNEWWSKNRTLNETKILINNSQLNFGLMNPNLIGYARVLTDYHDTAIILDVIIKNEFKRIGLGTLFLKNILAHKQVKKIDKIDLHCKGNLFDFYHSLGFVKNLNEMIWFRRKL